MPTEIITYSDTGSWDLANRIRDSAVATEQLYLGGSRYTIIVTDGATAADSTDARHPRTLTDSAIATEQVTAIRTIYDRESAVARETVLTTKKATITVTDSAVATDSATPFYTAVITDGAVATEQMASVRPLTLTDAAAASESATALRKAAIVVTDGAVAEDNDGDAPRAPVIIGVSAAAVATEQVTPILRAMQTVADAAVATESVVSKVTAIILDAAVAEEAIAAAGIFTVTVEDSAEADDYLRLPALAIPNLYVNAKTGAAAQWADIPVESMIEVDGALYGAGPDGLFTLADGGNDPDDTPVSWNVTWDLSNFGSAQKKRIAAVYVAAASRGPFTVRLATDHGRADVQTRLPQNAKATNHRALTPRGLEAVYFRVGVRGNKDFGADHVIVEYESVARRIT